MDDILIDRLVLNVPGLSTHQAEDLARRVGEGLASASPRQGDFGSLIVDLNDRALSKDLPRLAEAIINSLLQQLE